MRIEQLDHVALHVRDVSKSCAFYSRVLQLPAMERPGFDFPGAWFRIGTTQELHLIGDRQLPVQSAHRGAHWAMQVEDLDGWEQHLMACEAEYLPRRLRPDGAEQIFVKDPDGYFIELCQPANRADGCPPGKASIS